jgi:hypothetical protein
LRALTFASPRLAIELQIAAEALLGQIAPTAAGQVRAEPVSGAPTSAIIDDLGWFEIRPAPAMPFRLRLIISDGDDVLTGWITP